MNVDQPFGVSIEHDGGDEARVVVVGDVDLGTASVLRQALLEASALGASRVVVDLDAVSFLDSTGLNAILGARAALGRDQRQLLVERASSRVWRVFEVTGVAHLLASDGFEEEPHR